jgi:hypothetical protein
MLRNFCGSKDDELTCTGLYDWSIVEVVNKTASLRLQSGSAEENILADAWQ